MLRGSHITMEQTRVDDGTWMPAQVEVRAATKIFFLKTLAIDRGPSYLEYTLAEAGLPRNRRFGDPVNTMPGAAQMGMPSPFL